MNELVKEGASKTLSKMYLTLIIGLGVLRRVLSRYVAEHKSRSPAKRATDYKRCHMICRQLNSELWRMRQVVTNHIS
jgi:hypothetical protein